jgi:cytochrome c-type biogenesis protein CcmH/NrfG
MMATMRLDRRIHVFTGGATAALLVLSPLSCKRKEEPRQAPPALPVQETPQVGSRPPPPLAVQKRIEGLRERVAQDPRDVSSWIALGNAYFDSERKADAVEAYGKALELQPDNPDVLTDQGVMYRELGAYDKAVLNFEKAASINPKHVQSLLNLGIVYAENLKDFDGAIKAWQRVIAAAPTSPQAGRAREFIERAKQMQQQAK